MLRKKKLKQELSLLQFLLEYHFSLVVMINKSIWTTTGIPMIILFYRT